MKKLIVIALAAFMFQPVSAQQTTATKPTVETRAERKTERLTRELQLTADQQPKVKAEIVKSITKSDAIQTKYNNDKSEAMKTEMKAARQELKTAMKAILTDVQFKKWIDMEKGRNHNKKQAEPRK
jgi:periplasmic protein CpxP/Spy